MGIERTEIIILSEKVNKFLKSKKGYTIILTGEQGAGKSEIVKEVLKSQDVNLSLHKQISFSQTAFARNVICVQYKADELFNGDEFSLYIWKNIIEQVEICFCNNLTTEERGFDKSQYVKLITKVVNDIGLDWLTVVPYFGEVTGKSYKYIKSIYSSYKDFKKQTEYEQLIPILNSRKEIFDKIKTYLFKISEKVSLIIYINNIQWADKSSLELLRYLCENIKIKTSQILIILTYSDSEITNYNTSNKNNFESLFDYLNNKSLLETIYVKNLSVLQIKEYLEFKKSPNRFTADLYDKLYELSRGNLFFLRIILESLSERGDIFHEEDCYFNKPIDSFKLPENLSGLINDRVKNLPTKVRNVINCAAVMGETFSVEVIGKLLEYKDIKMENLIHELGELKFIVPSKKKIGGFKKIYDFYQSLIHKSVYSNYETIFRLEKHKKIAMILKEYFNENHIDLYLYHWGIGNQIINEHNEAIITEEDLYDNEALDLTYEYLNTTIKLSEKYSQHFMPDEILDLYDKIIYLSSVLKKDDIGMSFTEKKIELLTIIGKYEDAFQVINSSLSEQDKENIAIRDLYKGDLYERQDKNQLAKQHYLNSGIFYKETGNKKMLAKAFGKIGVVYFKEKNYETAMDYFNKKIEISDELSLIAEKYNALLEIGNIHLEKNELDKAETIYIENEKFNRENNNLIELNVTIGNLGIVYREKKDYKKAMKYLEEKLLLSKKTFDTREEMKSYGNMANFHLDMKEFKLAIHYYELSIELANKLEEISFIAGVYGNMGMCYYEMGDLNRALFNLKEAITISKNIDNELFEMTFLESFVLVKQKLSDYSDIEEYMIRGKSIAEKLNSNDYIKIFTSLLETLK